jgi:hypothetical protein
MGNEVSGLTGFWNRLNRHVILKMRWVLLFLIIPPLFLSCVSLSPKITEPAETIEKTTPVWQLLETSPSPGEGPVIAYFAGRVREPKLEFWSLRADLSDTRLKIIVNNPASSIHVSSFVREYNCIAGINASPFDPVSGREGEARTNVGIVISEGIEVSPPAADYDALFFFRDGSSAIASQSEIKDAELIENAIGGFRIVLEKGGLPERLTGMAAPELPRHPRSAAGLSEDGKTLYLLAVDGRRLGSRGATEAELGLLLKQLGAFKGLNFDGGGSTALALRFLDGKVRTVNTPIHNLIPGLERGVAACLGLAVRD